MLNEKIQLYRDKLAACKQKQNYPNAPKAEIVDLANQLYQQGWTWAKIAEELKISNTTLSRWKQEVQNPFVPVIIENEHDEVIKEATITIRSDSGFSIIGLTLEQAIFAMVRLA